MSNNTISATKAMSKNTEQLDISAIKDAELAKILQQLGNFTEGDTPKSLQLIAQLTQIHRSSSSLPDIATLKGLKEIYPESLPWLFERIKDEQKHRQALDDRKMKIYESEHEEVKKLSSRGMVYGFVLSLLALGLVGFGFYTGAATAAASFGAAVIIGLATVFIRAGTARTQRSSQEKNSSENA